MDRLKKALLKLSTGEKRAIKNILLKIKNGFLNDLDIKKLRNCNNIYRVRKGKLRIIFKKQENGDFFVLAIERRSDNTYNNLT